MKLHFTVQGLPPKKDGANSMWRKSTEVPRLKALRAAASQAMQGKTYQRSAKIYISVQIYSIPRDGDLDNFITGICDGLMGVHRLTPVLDDDWQDMPQQLRPAYSILFDDDSYITKISAERVMPSGTDRFYEVEIEWLDTD